MRIAAIYIHPSSYEYIFGEDHKAITLNLGGKYIYELNEIGNKTTVVSRNHNPQFIDSFWPENILNVSAIVGANGTGKSTILQLIKTGCQLVIENESGEEIIGSSDVGLLFYYTPFLNENRADEDRKNVINISKLSRMQKDSEFENMDFNGHWEYHKSERLKQITSFVEEPEFREILSDLKITRFDKIKIQFKRLTKDNSNTSSNFTPFFDALQAKAEEERGREEQKVIDRLRLQGRQELKDSEEYNLFSRNLRLKLTILDSITRKIHSILESTGNTFLEEGFVGENLTPSNEKFQAIESTREAFQWFIEKAFVELNSVKHKLPVDEILYFTDLLLSQVDKDNDIGNWTILTVDFKNSRQIIQSYQKFLVSFKNIFTYDETVFMTFYPDKNLSTGEMSMYELFSSFYHSSQRLTQKLDEEIHQKEINHSHYTFLLDEADLGFHPFWKRKYINYLCKLIPKIFPNKPHQIIITTHDPLTLSDIPNSNIAYLKKEGDKTELLQIGDPLRPDKSFAANITDLLSNSFFLENGLIGDFAKNKINNVLGFLNIKILQKEIRKITKEQEIKHSDTKDILKIHKEMELNELLKTTPELSFSYCKSLIDIVDEPLLKSALEEMYYELNPNKEESIESIKAYAKRLGRNDIADQL